VRARNLSLARKRVSFVSRRQPSRRASRATTLELRTVLEAARLSPMQLAAIERRYGARAADALQAQPYRLVQEIEGISFQTADTIARKLGTSKASRARLRAGILVVLEQSVRQGQTGLPMPTAIRRATRLLGGSRAQSWKTTVCAVC
jgi:exodeoxyribonuclease V alpha subunit